MPNLRKHSSIALTYFFIVSLLGLLLRFFQVTSIPLNYNNILHTHSHAALLGWVYLGFTTLIYRVFLVKAEAPQYKWIFLLTNFSAVGMLIAFPIQGYGLYSITASTLFLLASYWFTRYALKHIPEQYKSKFSWKIIKITLFYLVFSSIGTWAIGPISAMAGTGSVLFNDALYFFLHFLYSGFFFLTLIGVIFKILENHGIELDFKKLDALYVNLNMGVFLTYFLSILWADPPIVFYLLGGIGAVYQIYGYFLLYKILKNHVSFIKKQFGNYAFKIIKFAAVLVGLRVLMQLISVLPYFAELAFSFRDFIIGYLHMVFLGIIIPLLLISLHYFKLITLPKKSMSLYYFTFITTESLIFYKGFAFWLDLPMFVSYYKILAGLSCLFPIAIGWLWIKNMQFSFGKKAQHKLQE